MDAPSGAYYKNKICDKPSENMRPYQFNIKNDIYAIKTVGNSNNYAVFLTVEGAAARTWYKTLVYKGGTNKPNAIVAQIIGDGMLATDLKHDNQALYVFSNDDIYEADDSMGLREASIIVKSKYKFDADSFMLISRESEFTTHKINKLKKKIGPSRAKEAARLNNEISKISSSSKYSQAEKNRMIRQKQDTLPREVFATAMRYLPVNDKGRITTLDRYVRDNFGRKHGSSSTPFEKDPIGSTVSIYFNASPSNIKSQLGIR
jgi:hypothetical protein